MRYHRERERTLNWSGTVKLTKENASTNIQVSNSWARLFLKQPGKSSSFLGKELKVWEALNNHDLYKQKTDAPGSCKATSNSKTFPSTQHKNPSKDSL